MSRPVLTIAGIGAALLLAGCANAIDGRAMTVPTISSPSVTTPEATTSSSPTTSTSPTADDAPVNMAIGEYITSWTDDGEADIVVLDAEQETVDGDSRLVVTVNYECYDGEFPYDVIDWTIKDSDGRRHYPEPESSFGEDSPAFGMMPDNDIRRGRIVFDVPADALTLEFSALSGDPATWLIPAGEER